MAGTAVYKGWIPDDIYLPAFSITAEEIFANELNLFDVNFFNPKPPLELVRNEYETYTPSAYSAFVKVYQGSTRDSYIDGGNYKWHDNNAIDGISGMQEIYSEEYSSVSEVGKYHDFILNCCNYFVNDRDAYGRVGRSIQAYYDDPNRQEDDKNVLKSLISRANSALEQKGYVKIQNIVEFDATVEEHGWQESAYNNTSQSHSQDPAYYIGKIETVPYVSQTTKQVALIVCGVKWHPQPEQTIITSTTIEKVHSTAGDLSATISKWYFILRNLALLVLMLVLIYSGIRIVIGSTAGEKAKYKERLKDWLVAICLIFIMHYIMVFAIEIVARITELVREGAGINGNVVYIELTDKQYENAKKIIESQEYDISQIGEITTENGEKALTWKTDLAGYFRIHSQMTEEGTAKWAGYALCYVVLVLFTLFFAWTYLKRVVYMAFLTIIAPLVAMTYPIDKMTDGKAQAFDAWLKEYIFNLMIQPLHLLLYAILVSSAFELATSSPIYALVTIGFMIPAEKLMRRFFGFEKAKTPGLLGGAAGAALAMSGIQSLGRNKSSGGKSSGIHEKTKEQNKVRFSNKNGVNAMQAVAGRAPTGGNQTGNTQSRAREQASNAGGIRAEEQQNNQVAENIRTTSTEVSDGSFAETSLGTSTGVSPEAFNSSQGANLNIPQTEEPRQKKRSIKRAVGAAAKATGKQLLGRALTGIHPLKLAGKIATGATLGTAGLLFGVASGDPSKAFQYTTAGAVAGSALAGSMSGNLVDMEKIKQETEMGYYGSDYKGKVIDDQKKAFQKDSSNINYLKQTMGVGDEDAKEILRTTGGKCFDNGITSIEDIATIHKLTKGENRISFDQAVAARNYAKKRLPSDPDQMTSKSVEEYKKRWREEYRQAGYANADELGNKSFDLAIRFYKEQSGLTKNP